MLERVAQEWRLFKADAPGERFRHHYERSQHEGRARKLLRLAVGILVLAAGIAMLVLPGPGILGMLFGLGLVAAHSRWLSKHLDRAELRIRLWRQRRNRRRS